MARLGKPVRNQRHVASTPRFAAAGRRSSTAQMAQRLPPTDKRIIQSSHSIIRISIEQRFRHFRVCLAVGCGTPLLGVDVLIFEEESEFVEDSEYFVNYWIWRRSLASR